MLRHVIGGIEQSIGCHLEVSCESGIRFSNVMENYVLLDRVAQNIRLGTVLFPGKLFDFDFEVGRYDQRAVSHLDFLFRPSRHDFTPVRCIISPAELFSPGLFTQGSATAIQCSRTGLPVRDDS